jgi:hypothetical protein
MTIIFGWKPEKLQSCATKFWSATSFITKKIFKISNQAGMKKIVEKPKIN